jgi:hypothetical protein
VIEAYLDRLGAELGRRGVRGRRRRRILAETEDHLRSDPEAAGRFGDAGEIAQAFADDLGTRGALAAPRWAFAALAVAGTFYAVIFVAWSVTGSLQAIATGGPYPALGLAAGAALIVAPQVGFVAGVLALTRVLRLRRRSSLPGAEVRALRRRTGLALASGLVTVGAVALFALQFGSQLPGWSGGVLGWGVVGAAASSAVLLAGGAVGLRGARARVAVAGMAGDVFDDLGPAVPAPLRGHPWRFAGVVSGGAGALVWIAGAVASDPYDGALRGLAEAAACFIGFAVLGRFLALRR